MLTTSHHVISFNGNCLRNCYDLTRLVLLSGLSNNHPQLVMHTLIIKCVRLEWWEFYCAICVHYNSSTDDFDNKFCEDFLCNLMIKICRCKVSHFWHKILYGVLKFERFKFFSIQGMKTFIEIHYFRNFYFTAWSWFESIRVFLKSRLASYCFLGREFFLLIIFA